MGWSNQIREAMPNPAGCTNPKGRDRKPATLKWFSDIIKYDDEELKKLYDTYMKSRD